MGQVTKKINIGGGPVVTEDLFLIGIIFQNLKFDDKNSVVVPDYSIAIGKDILYEVLKNTDNENKLLNLWIFHPIADKKFENLFSWEDRDLKTKF